MKRIHLSRALYGTLVAVALFGAGCLIQNRPVTPPQPNPPTPTATSTTDTTSTTALLDTTGWKTYENKKTGFGFSYPADWIQDMKQVAPNPMLTNEFWDAPDAYAFLYKLDFKAAEEASLEVIAVHSTVSAQKIEEDEGLNPSSTKLLGPTYRAVLNGIPVVRQRVEHEARPYAYDSSIRQISYYETVLVEDGLTMYRLVFTDSGPNQAIVDQHTAEWRTLLSTFHSFKPTK